jgi:hypothetical protein
MMLEAKPNDAAEMAFEDRVIEKTLIAKTQEYMEQLVMDQIKPHIKQLAVDAVKDWIHVRTSKQGATAEDPFAMNYNIQFIEKVVNRMSDTVNINVKGLK